MHTHTLLCWTPTWASEYPSTSPGCVLPGQAGGACNTRTLATALGCCSPQCPAKSRADLLGLSQQDLQSQIRVQGLQIAIGHGVHPTTLPVAPLAGASICDAAARTWVRECTLLGNVIQNGPLPIPTGPSQEAPPPSRRPGWCRWPCQASPLHWPRPAQRGGPAPRTAAQPHAGDPGGNAPAGAQPTQTGWLGCAGALGGCVASSLSDLTGPAPAAWQRPCAAVVWCISTCDSMSSLAPHVSLWWHG